MTITYILAAGNQTRWLLGRPDYKHQIKQLVPIHGEPLIRKTSRQAKANSETKIITNNTKIKMYADCETVRADRHGSIVESLLSQFRSWEDYDRIVLLLGDVNFSNNAIKTIYSYDGDIMFFGSRQEIFAVVFTDIAWLLMQISHLVHEGWMPLSKMKLWHLYRFLTGVPKDKHVISDMFTFIKDGTRDFDDWRQYEKWLKNDKRKH